MMYQLVFNVGTDDQDVAMELSDLMFSAVMDADERELEYRGLMPMPEMAGFVGKREGHEVLVNGKALDALIDALGPASDDVVDLVEEQFGKLVL